MINIEERITSKVPGETSFFISFPYNTQIINIIKNLNCKNYSKKSKEWEVPLIELKYLIDNLCELDDIKLKLIEDTPNINSTTTTIKSSFKTAPFPHQLDSIKYGLNHDKWLLLDGMGCGKTNSAIFLAEELKLTKGLNHCLIICGVNSLKSNWKKEIEKYSSLDCIILGEKKQRNGKIITGSISDRINHILKPINEFFIITNIETLRSKDMIEALYKSPNNIDMIVVDEIHKCCCPSSKQSQNLLELKSTYQLGMTGTLLINNPLDLYVPLNWIDADRSTLTNFKTNYCNFEDKFSGIIIGYKNLDYLKLQLNKYSLRRTNDILNLPLKTIIPEYLDMDEKQQKFYDEVKKGIKDNIDKVKLTPSSLLAMATRLRQATSCPSILTSNNIESIKLNRAKEIVESVISNGNKIVIFSTFKESIYKLKKMLIEYNPLVNTGDTEDEEISNNIDKFQSDDNYKLFIGTWQKCGTGLTLTAANYMVFIDTPWTNASFQQACDRIYRIGTKYPVFIYNLICKDTIDEEVLHIINTKGDFSNYIIDNIITQSSLDNLRKYIEDLK